MCETAGAAETAVERDKRETRRDCILTTGKEEGMEQNFVFDCGKHGLYSFGHCCVTCGSTWSLFFDPGDQAIIADLGQDFNTSCTPL